VADLHEAIDLRAAPHAGFANSGAIDRSETLHFDVVFDDGDAGIGRILAWVPSARSGENQSRRLPPQRRSAGSRGCRYAKLTHGGVRMGEKIVADLDAFVDHYMRMEDGVAADL